MTPITPSFASSASATGASSSSLPGIFTDCGEERRCRQVRSAVLPQPLGLRRIHWFSYSLSLPFIKTKSKKTIPEPFMVLLLPFSQFNGTLTPFLSLPKPSLLTHDPNFEMLTARGWRDGGEVWGGKGSTPTSDMILFCF